MPQHAITFVIPGQAQRTRGAPAAAARGAGPGTAGVVKTRVLLSARRAGADTVRVSAVPGEDVVVLHLAGGPTLTLHPENARDLLLGQGSATRSAAPAEVAVPAQLRWHGLEQAAPTRGAGFLGGVLLQAFEVITGIGSDTLQAHAADFAASQVVARVDGQVEAGVYALQRESLAPLKGSGQLLARVPAPAQPAQQPLLVLIHGTFVDTFSTFGKLWSTHPQRVDELFNAYQGRVYALDHPTVGASPIANALTLVNTLPTGARLHLLTHSRGGLVAEVLALVCGRMGGSDPHAQPIGAADLACFPGPEHARHREELQALAAAVKAKRIAVDRVVRVACPARGTLLASQRLDAYLSVLKWTIELAGVPVVPALLDFLTEVARRRANPSMLPGLAAMIPETPLLNWLNGQPAPIPGTLRVVAGDLQGDSLGSWLKTLLADAYYWTDNDIVVHTRSMYGGAPRSGSASFLLDQGGKTTHFAYFANERTVQAVVGGLTQEAPAGFRPIGPLSWAGEDASGQRGAASAASRGPGSGASAGSLPAVFVLPGILGSNLRAGPDNGGERIWLSLRLIGGLSKLKYQPGGADGVQPDGPVGLIYNQLMDHLAQTHEVIPFGYDWRRPLEEEARRLADAVDAALDARSASGQPVRIVAHSMGGLLTRTLQLERPKTFDRLMQRSGARVLMLGTPNGGSWAPMQCLTGDDTFGNLLANFGSPFRDGAARQLMADMPGFLQLQAGLLDPALALDQAATWQRMAADELKALQAVNWWHRYGSGDGPNATEATYQWGLPPQPVLQQARALRQRLDQQRDTVLKTYADRLLLVVGRAPTTPDGFEWVAPQGLSYLNAPHGGDGRVPLENALLPGVRTWQLDAEHGDLPDVASAFDAYVELLQQGSTQRLPVLDPAQRGPAQPALRSRPSRGRPAALPASNLRAVFSNAPQAEGLSEAAPAPSALKVTVLNGNLSFVRQALLVGHSRSLNLTGTEAVVNSLIGGAMKASLDAGLYPDAPGSHQIFVNTRSDPDNPWRTPQPAQVVVAGLGEEGKLGEADLVRTVRQAVVAWVQRRAEDPDHAGVTLELSATLMGTGGVGMHPGSAARAVAQGVREANQRLAAQPQNGWPIVSQLTLVELYLERASDAWHGLQVLATAAPGHYDVAPTILSGVGPLRRQIDSGYRGTDYDFITATSDGDDTISFALDTKRARTEVRAQTTQGKLLRELVKRASTAENQDARLGHTLFQLLVPTEVEPFLAGTSRMLLELDDRTAPIPWELLDTRGNDASAAANTADDRPWAIRTQLLRKLRQENFRQQVQDAQPDDAVLVIGEPAVDETVYPPLPGARAEAEAVAAAFSGPGGLGGERVNALVDGNDAASVINALFERRYRIVHVAGHGEPVRRDDATQKILAMGGVVLSDGTFLGPDEIRSMRTVPELVFVNCCHLAARDSGHALKAFNRAEFAWGVADSLIEIGVRCVIAAGWAVDDGPAKVFATTFYREVLAGRSFIHAVAVAREAAWNEDKSSHTWAAYQAYGDPNWVFRRGSEATATVPVAPQDEFAGVASPLGLALALEEQAVKSKWMRANPAAQLDKIRHLEARFGALWGGMGAIAEAFGLAYAEAGDEAQAVAWYARAVRCSDSSASMKAQEQLGSLRARLAWSQLGPQPSAAALRRARREIHEAIDALQSLARLQPTLDRHSLHGSAWKRLALLEGLAGDARAESEALAQSAAAYTRAEELARTQGDPHLFYPALNRMALDLVVHAGDTAWPGFDAAAVQAVRSSLLDKQAQDPDFWCYEGLLELEVYEALARRRLAAALDDRSGDDAPAGLLSRYEELHARVSGLSMWGSVADTAGLVLSHHQRHASKAEAAAAKRLLGLLQGFAKD